MLYNSLKNEVVRKVAALAIIASFAGEASAVLKSANAEESHNEHGNRRERIEQIAMRLREVETCARHGRRRPRKTIPTP